MKTFYHQSSSLSSIDGAEAESSVLVVVEIEGELDIDTSPFSDVYPDAEESMSTMELASRSPSIRGAATRRRRRHRQSRSSSTTSEDSIGSRLSVAKIAEWRLSDLSTVL